MIAISFSAPILSRIFEKRELINSIFIINISLYEEFLKDDNHFSCFEIFTTYKDFIDFFHVDSLSCDWKEYEKVAEFHSKHRDNSYILEDGSDTYNVFSCDEFLIKILNIKNFPWNNLTEDDYE